MRQARGTRRRFLKTAGFASATLSQVGLAPFLLGAARGGDAPMAEVPVAEAPLADAPAADAPAADVPAADVPAADVPAAEAPRVDDGDDSRPVDPEFLVRREELKLDLRRGPVARRLAFAQGTGSPESWREACRKKLAELAGIPGVTRLPPDEVRELRSTSFLGVTCRLLVLEREDGLSLPAYLLEPREGKPQDGKPWDEKRREEKSQDERSRDERSRDRRPQDGKPQDGKPQDGKPQEGKPREGKPQEGKTRGAVLAIQGHGEVEPVIGAGDDYHRRFGLELARAGYTVLCPALRGFGVLSNVSWSSGGRRCLDYWDGGRGRQFTLATDAFIHGRTLIGDTVEDLLRWERWLCAKRGFVSLDVAGISYGGDLAILYPVFSSKVRRIFASGTFGSFRPIFAECYNAPAHCIPGILEWMDRSDIAGLCAPRPIALHYGDRDRPSPENNSAAFNESVAPALEELRTIYRAFGAGDSIRLIVSPECGHEMDVRALIDFLA